MEINKQKYYIYKYIQNNTIIYIGKTINLKRRIAEHNKEKKFKQLNNNYKIYYFLCNNKTEMDSYEYFLITKYNPLLNVTFNNVTIKSDIKEPKWILYDKKDFLNDQKKLTTINDKNIIFNNFLLSEQKLLLYYFYNNKKHTSPPRIFEWLNWYGNKSGKYHNIFNNFKFSKEYYNSKIYNLSCLELKKLRETKSKYSIPILEYFLNYDEIDRDKFLSNFSYTRYPDFKRKVLNAAIEDLKSLGFNCNYFEIKKGKKVVKIKFDK